MEQAILQYLEAYNTQNIPAMLALLDETILFENVSNASEVTQTKNKQEFEQLARQSLPFYSERRQVIRFMVLGANAAAVEIDYRATLAQDLPNGMKAGDSMQLRGVSIFEMNHGKFTRISDYS